MASLQKNLAGQNITFCLVVAATGAADATGTGLAGKITIDNGSQGSVSGTFTNKGNGQYNYAPTQAETNGTDIGFLFTATGDIPVNIDFHTDPLNFSSLNLDSLGNVGVTSTFKKNIARAGFTFPMTDSVTHALKTGVVFNSAGSQRTIDGNPLAATTNLPVEVGGGLYSITLSAADLNGNNITFLWVMPGTDPTLIEIPTQP